MLLDPVLERMMDAVHRYEGTVNQMMGDGIMALFGAPIAHEDHAVRACYIAIRRYAEDVRPYATMPTRTSLSGSSMSQVIVAAEDPVVPRPLGFETTAAALAEARHGRDSAIAYVRQRPVSSPRLDGPVPCRRAILLTGA